ncbi:hypothetical protein AXF42_Ash000671 [Apostasia shenzhenica]|uniref:Uncharacterized protein n=1 Tax=Apostasia shenzhenica TaxID=1088818 RepID=A0A2I0AH66_9ASPA|nr:hypothetical protein AXF42_Ash000671 [Apostasia shenzhenica]
MASNSRLLLPLFLFTATVAIAAAQPTFLRDATPEELLDLTQFIASLMRRLNAIHSLHIDASTVERYIGRVSVSRAVAEVVSSDAVIMYRCEIWMLFASFIRSAPVPFRLTMRRVMTTAVVQVTNGDFNEALLLHVANFMSERLSP